MCSQVNRCQPPNNENEVDEERQNIGMFCIYKLLLPLILHALTNTTGTIIVVRHE